MAPVTDAAFNTPNADDAAALPPVPLSAASAVIDRGQVVVAGLGWLRGAELVVGHSIVDAIRHVGADKCGCKGHSRAYDTPEENSSKAEPVDRCSTALAVRFVSVEHCPIFCQSTLRESNFRVVSCGANDRCWSCDRPTIVCGWFGVVTADTRTE
jgi:hypothetical protein